MISIRKLAAVDMLIHGKRFIIGEFAIGVLLALVLGLITLRSYLTGSLQFLWAILGIWLIGIAANYIPLFIYSVMIAKGGTVQEEGQPELAHIKRYSVQQLILFIPFLVTVLTLVQESHQRRDEK
jgi:hypothetical protein